MPFNLQLNSVMSDSKSRFNDALEAWKMGDKETAIPVIRDEAERGNVEAQHLLGTCYQVGGWGVEKNADQALYWLKRADEAGCPHSARNLGMLYDPNWENAIQVEKNADVANQYYQRSLDRYMAGIKDGKWEFMDNVADCYNEGFGVVPDHEKFLQWRAEYEAKLSEAKGNATDESI